MRLQKVESGLSKSKNPRFVILGTGTVYEHLLIIFSLFVQNETLVDLGEDSVEHDHHLF